jgi:actin-related protein
VIPTAIAAADDGVGDGAVAAKRDGISDLDFSIG